MIAVIYSEMSKQGRTEVERLATRIVIKRSKRPLRIMRRRYKANLRRWSIGQKQEAAINKKKKIAIVMLAVLGINAAIEVGARIGEAKKP